LGRTPQEEVEVQSDPPADAKAQARARASGSFMGSDSGGDRAGTQGGMGSSSSNCDSARFLPRPSDRFARPRFQTPAPAKIVPVSSLAADSR
jgi:hypothetical protein